MYKYIYIYIYIHNVNSYIPFSLPCWSYQYSYHHQACLGFRGAIWFRQPRGSGSTGIFGSYKCMTSGACGSGSNFHNMAIVVNFQAGPKETLYLAGHLLDLQCWSGSQLVLLWLGAPRLGSRSATALGVCGGGVVLLLGSRSSRGTTQSPFPQIAISRKQSRGKLKTRKRAAGLLGDLPQHAK